MEWKGERIQALDCTKTVFGVTGNFPPRGGALTREQAHLLLAETVIFNPNAIASSYVPLEPETPLDVGQDLQVKWGDAWWAGAVTRIESDGQVRVHYFGWADSWDEVKPRAELQWDTNARVHALDSTYVRDGW